MAGFTIRNLGDNWEIRVFMCAGIMTAGAKKSHG